MLVLDVPSSSENCNEEVCGIQRMGNDFPVLWFNLFNKSNPASPIWSDVKKFQHKIKSLIEMD